ncbi:MAG: DUF2062 domain-containing protein [Sulfuricella sp.]|nr:DUF2062 domain-containing protein [Sulfuricella sp.]
MDWRRLIPIREVLLANRWLRWLAPWLGHPKLWHWSRRGVALGVALGVFFGLLIPLAQIPLTAAAVVLRANLPAAAASTLISNPVTFAPLYYTAYHLGAWVTGETAIPSEVCRDERHARGKPNRLATRQSAGQTAAGGLVNHGMPGQE